jgi:hypothetical protein
MLLAWFMVRGVGFGIFGLGSEFRVQGLGFGIEGRRAQGLFKVCGLEFRVQGLGFGIEGRRFSVEC